MSSDMRRFLIWILYPDSTPNTIILVEFNLIDQQGDAMYIHLGCKL